MTNDQRQTISGYVSDMLALERHILEPIQHQANDETFAKYGYAATLAQRIKSEVDAHITDLSAALESLGGHGTHPIKEAWSAFTGAAASAVNSARSNAVSRGLRDDYTALALATAGYTLLHATATGLGATSIADLAERNLKGYTPFVMELSRALPRIAIDELRDDGQTLDPSATAETIATTQEAWRNPSRATTSAV